MQYDQFARYCAKMATGSGKTKVASLAIAWQYFNAVAEGSDEYAKSFLTQLASIDGITLRAPEGEKDDRADSYALACVGMIDVQESGSGTDIPLDQMSMGRNEGIYWGR